MLTADVSTLSFIQSNGIIAGTTSGNVTYLEIDDNKVVHFITT